MARDRFGTIAFRNSDQRILWECEIKGQLSDGKWENTLPYDHWEPWCFAQTVVDPLNVGIQDMWPRKRGYALTAADLLDVVGDRMLGYVRLSRVIGADDPDLVEAVEGVLSHPSIVDHYSAAARDVVEKYGRAALEAAEQDAAIYSDKQMRADLRDIQAIMKVNRKSDAALTAEREREAKERVEREARERRSVLTRYSVLTVALERANADLGPVTDEEAAIIKEQQAQLRSGAFRPDVSDIRLIA